jgi:hypothetical protein
MLKKLETWHKTRMGFLAFALIEAGMFYGFASLSIASGGLWWYLASLVLFLGVFRNLINLIGTFFHGKQHTTSKA